MLKKEHNLHNEELLNWIFGGTSIHTKYVLYFLTEDF